MGMKEAGKQPAEPLAVRSALRLTLIYGVAALFWVVLFHHLLSWLGVPEREMQRIHTAMDWVFALVSVLLVWVLARREIRRLHAVQREQAESQRILQTLMQNLPGMAYRCRNDRHWTMEFVSEGCQTLTGYPPQALLMNALVSYSELIHEADRQRVWETVQAQVARGEPFQLEYRLRTRSGELKWVWEQGRPVVGSEDGELHLEGLVIDISERRHAEQEVNRRSQQQETLSSIIAVASSASEFAELLQKPLAMILEAFDLQDGLAVVGGHSHVQGVPQPLAARLCREIERLLKAQPVLLQVDELGGDGQPAGGDELAQLLRSGGYQAMLAVPIPADGRQVGCLAVFSRSLRAWDSWEARFLEAVGRQLGGAASRLDLFEALHEQAAVLQRILDTVSGGIFTLDQDMRLLIANRAARQLLSLLGGVSPGEVLRRLGDRPIEELLVPRPDGLPHEIIHEGPQQRIFELVPSAYQDENGGGGWTVLLRDVTEIRRAQHQVQEQERQASVGQLAAGIAHDFNNIVAAIILFSDMLLAMDELPEKARQRAETIQAQAQRAAALTRQILDFSRRGVLEPHPLDLVPLLKELLKLLERTFPENIQLRFHYGDESYVVNSDPGRMQQVLLNLALFARDSMPEGGELTFQLGCLHVKGGEPPPIPGLLPGDWVEIQVRDTGPGIAAEHLPHLFEPYFTLDPSRSGPGLGMAQVRGVVEQHQGRIEVSSRPGEGTVFCIYLPALPESAITGIIPEKQGAPRGGRETILVVEDDPAMRSALCEMLAGLNYRILSAKNGKEALEIYRSQGPVDLVLSDLVMPEMGGVALYEELSRQDPNLRMVVMTGYPLAEGGRELLEQGIFAWVQKPLNLQALAQTLRSALLGQSRG